MKRISKLLFSLAILVTILCGGIDAQNAAKNWVFGNRARIDFNSGSAVASFVNTLNTTEGSSSVSDSTGSLLFYTDGITVWNKNNTVMPHGTGLTGDPSSTHSALIVPCSCNKYFIFTTDSAENTYVRGFRYSVVDMTADGGLGDVISPANNLLFAPASEKIAGTSDGNGGFWVVAHEMGNAIFRAYHITPISCQISAPVLSTAGKIYPGGAINLGQGQMKISPNGKRLAVADLSYQSESYVELFKFDSTPAGGTVSELTAPHTITGSSGAYGVEFSPNSRYLYSTTVLGNNFIFRYDISGNTLTNLAQLTNLGTTRYLAGALQLAPDGKIYMSRRKQNFISVLSNPDMPVPWVDVHFNLTSPSESTLGLPTVVAGDFSCGQQGCCDQVKVAPFWTPDLSLSWKAFEVFNVKFPASPICSIDIDIRSATNQPPPNPWNGGGLKVNGTALAVPTWWKSPYTRIPNGTNLVTTIAGQPNFSAAAVNFNLGLDYSGTYTGKVKFIIRHCDGTTCDYLSDNWTPEPPTQLAMRVNERYLGDLRGEYLPLSLGFSDGLNIKTTAKWIAVEPMDADTEVFSVDGDRGSGIEQNAERSQLMVSAARKQERSALYELAVPVDLERFTGGEIKLVLKRSPGNPVKPRLRFLFFDENANLIGYSTNDKY